MIDKFLEVGSSMDGITPLWGFVQDLWYGSPFQVNLPAACGYSAGTIERSLRASRVRVWGTMVVGQTITFTVHKSQAHLTLRCLEYWRVPIEGHSKLPKEKRR